MRNPRAKRPAAEAGNAPFAGIAPRFIDWSSVALLLGVAAFAVFQFPYNFPGSVPVASQSYAVGFSNRAAAMAVLAFAGMFCIRNLLWRRAAPEAVDQLFALDRGGKSRPTPNMPVSIVLVLIAIYLGVAFLIYAWVPYLDEYGEPLGTLPRFEQLMKCHLRLYSEMDWPYGPGLFYFFIACIKAAGWFGIGPELAYMFSYSCISIAALAVLYYVVNSLRLKVANKVVLFSLFAICSWNPCLGTQYNCLRYLAPYAALLLVHQAATRMPPEKDRTSLLKLCGLCFLCRVVCPFAFHRNGSRLYSRAVRLLRAPRHLRQPPVALSDARGCHCLPLLLLCFPDCMHVLQGFSKGGNNFPVVPSPHIVLYLLTLFWILPILLRPGLLLRRHARVGMAMAWAAVVVATMPAALGHCDPGHVMFNGMGAFLIAMAVMTKFRPRLYPNYALGFFFFFGVALFLAQPLYYESYFRPIQLALAGRPVPADDSPSPLVEKLALKDYASIAAPLGVDRATREFLLDTGRFAPECHPDFGNVFYQEELERKSRASRRRPPFSSPRGCRASAT